MSGHHMGSVLSRCCAVNRLFVVRNWGLANTGRDDGYRMQIPLLRRLYNSGNVSYTDG